MGASSGPPGWGLGVRLTTSPCKKESVTETLTGNLQPIGYQGPSNPSQAGMTSRSESQPEAVAVKLGVLCTKTKTRIVPLGLLNPDPI